MEFGHVETTYDAVSLGIALVTNIGALIAVIIYARWWWKLRSESDTALAPLMLAIAISKVAVWFWSASNVWLVTVENLTLPWGSLPARLFFMVSTLLTLWAVVRVKRPEGDRVPGPFETISAVKGKVLIIDDEIALGNVYRKTLMGQGYACEHVQTATAALTYIARYAPDVLLVDMLLADGTDGIELVEKARIAGFTGVAIAMSGAIGRFDRQQMSLFSDALQKPLRYDDLIAAVQRARAPAGPKLTLA